MAILKIIAFVAALLMVGGIAPDNAARAATPIPIKVYRPCPLPIATIGQACVIVTQYLTTSGNSVTTTLDTAKGRVFAGKVKTYSVVYAYRLTSTPNGTAAISVESGRFHQRVGDAYANRFIVYWRTTHDGGKSWGDIETNEDGTFGG